MLTRTPRPCPGSVYRPCQIFFLTGIARPIVRTKNFSYFYPKIGDTHFASMKIDKKKILEFVRKHFSLGKAFLVVFVIFILFIDENSCIQRVRYDRQINNLRQQIAAQNDTTDYYNRQIERLKTDKNVIEQIAREQYYMSKPSEDIYIIEPKKQTH